MVVPPQELQLSSEGGVVVPPRVAPMSAAECARRILRGVANNRAIIPVSSYVWLDWWLYRAAPWLSRWT